MPRPTTTRSGRWKRWVLATAALGFIVAASAAVGTWALDRSAQPEQGLLKVPRGQSWFENNPAPDFVLPDARTGLPVTFPDPTDRRPTVLIFGSFSCDLFCGQIGEIRRLHRRYGHLARFLLVYIREAPHPNPGLDEFLQARSATGRGPRINGGLEYFQLDIPCVDDHESRAGERYAAFPERLFLIDEKGMVYWDSTGGMTPEGLRLPEGEARLRELLNVK